MHITLLQQYHLVLSAREALFDYCETISSDHLNTQLSTFNNQSIVSQLIHTANCYTFWLANSAMQLQRPYVKEEDSNLVSMREAYQQVDLTMNDFLQNFKDTLSQQIFITRPDGNSLTCSPLNIFTHAITHEFHHKGQIVSMSRQLGYTPVDTDVIRS